MVIETDQTGVVIKADALGSLEAMISLLRDAQVPIKRASIGPISKKDILDAEANREGDPLLAVVLGFNVKLQEHVDPGAVKGPSQRSNLQDNRGLRRVGKHRPRRWSRRSLTL